MKRALGSDFVRLSYTAYYLTIINVEIYLFLMKRFSISKGASIIELALFSSSSARVRNPQVTPTAKNPAA